MSTDPDTVRDNSGSLRIHRHSRASSRASSEPSSGSIRPASTASRLRPVDEPSGAAASGGGGGGGDPPGGPSPSGPPAPASASALGIAPGSEGISPRRPRTLSVSLQAAATLNAAEQKDAIGSLSHQERRSISVGAAGAGLTSTDEITTLTTAFGFTDPNFAGAPGSDMPGTAPGPSPAPDSHRPSQASAFISPRTNAGRPASLRNDGGDGGNGGAVSPGTLTMPPPPPPSSSQPPPTGSTATPISTATPEQQAVPVQQSLSSPTTSLAKTPSQRRKSAIALNLMLADPTLPSPGELSCSDRRASISSSGMAPAWGYAQRTGSIAGSVGSLANGPLFRTGSVSRGASIGGGGASIGDGARPVYGIYGGNPGLDERHRRMSVGEVHQEQEQDNERVVLRLFDRIHALESEITRLRLENVSHRHRRRHSDRTASPSLDLDSSNTSDLEQNSMLEEDEVEDTDMESLSYPAMPLFSHSHPASVRTTASHPASAPGINIGMIPGSAQGRSPSQPIAIPDPHASASRGRSAFALTSPAGGRISRSNARSLPSSARRGRLTRSRSGSGASAGSWITPPLGGSIGLPLRGLPTPTISSAIRTSSPSPSSPLARPAATAADTVPEIPDERPSAAAGRGPEIWRRQSSPMSTDAPTPPSQPQPQSQSQPLSSAARDRDERLEYWRSEATNLSREMQRLRRRNQELERLVTELRAGSGGSGPASASVSGSGNGNGGRSAGEAGADGHQ